jgi:hypothetical protein
MLLNSFSIGHYHCFTLNQNKSVIIQLHINFRHKICKYQLTVVTSYDVHIVITMSLFLDNIDRVLFEFYLLNLEFANNCADKCRNVTEGEVVPVLN